MEAANIPALGDKSILPERARNDRVPPANLRAFISPLMGGRMVGGWRQCTDLSTECRCLSLWVGIASGGFGAHWNGNEPDTVGIAGGVGGKVGMEV